MFFRLGPLAVAALLCLFARPLPAQTAGGAPAKPAVKGPSDTAFYRDYVLLDREKQEEADRDKLRAERKGRVYSAEDEKPSRKLTFDVTGVVRPRSKDDFAALWHLPPKRQWWTGNCWCFSATSLMESEIHRVHGLTVKLSEPFTVYWEFVEKAREFVRTKGKSEFGEGSQSAALILRWKQYGIVRETDYTGLVKGAVVFDQGPLMEDLKGYLACVKSSEMWDEDLVTGSVRLILDRHLGRPPEKIEVGGRSLTPPEYLRDVLRLDLDAYVEFMSFLYEPFWAKGEYKVPDNYWHGKEYHNVPLDAWYDALRGAVKKGFTVCIGGDVSEPGYIADHDTAVVPPFDIPGDRIDQSAREYRFDAGCSTDDHGIHVVGHTELDGHDWYLIKDSSRSAQRGLPGYYFYRDDYIRLKMLTFMVHRDAVGDLLARFARESAAAAAPAK
ncbi:MAG: peptidase C1 [Acidobacteria bacterium]|nr:peptidase C1 [Acidobacteriota bacterium]